MEGNNETTTWWLNNRFSEAIVENVSLKHCNTKIHCRITLNMTHLVLNNGVKWPKKGSMSLSRTNTGSIKTHNCAKNIMTLTIPIV